MSDSPHPTNIFIDVKHELAKAEERYPPMHSAHEAWAIIKEEVDELWEAVRLKQTTPNRDDQMRKEAIQIAAMAIRFIKDLPHFRN